MFARSSLRVAQRSAAVIRADHGPVSSWGPLNFAGANWKGDGALPFTTTKRARFLALFWGVVIVGFGLPFANTEWKLAPLREAKRQEKAAAKE
ncbi:hypothetical protein DFJ77DRAFT_459082 [Powellomyces hirtus]|nr:hypothetical protein DFJ77DRAFT_459082 [Powellomyces hirtus]